MTKTEAIESMNSGKRVIHKYFSPDEWMTIIDGLIVLEDGVRFTPEVFWHWRGDSSWEDSYDVYIEDVWPIRQLEAIAIWEVKSNFAQVIDATELFGKRPSFLTNAPKGSYPGSAFTVVPQVFENNEWKAYTWATFTETKPSERRIFLHYRKWMEAKS